jgi:hypothetical protein
VSSLSDTPPPEPKKSKGKNANIPWVGPGFPVGESPFA